LIYSGVLEDKENKLDSKSIYSVGGLVIDLNEEDSDKNIAGGLHAKNAAITSDGELYAQKGKIGGWLID
jgi:hypothetical protein